MRLAIRAWVITALILMASSATEEDGWRVGEALHAQTAQRIAVVPEPGTPVVAVELLLTTGPADEGIALAGIAHLSARAIAAGLRSELDSMGVHLNVAAQKDALSFSLIAAPDAWKPASRLLIDALFREAPDSAGVEAERRVVIAQLAAREANPADAATRELDSAFFGATHPWGRPTVGTPQSLGRIRPRDVADFVDEHFLPGRALVAVVGPVEEADVRAHLSGLLGSGAPAPVEVVPFRSAERPVRRAYNSITTWVAASFRFPETADEEVLRFVAHLAGETLSFSPSQRSVYDVSADVFPRAGGGEIRLQVVVPPEESDLWADRVSEAFADLESRTLPDDVFNGNLRRFRGNRILDLITPEARAYEAARQLLVHGRFEGLVPESADLTQARVREAARSLNEPTIVVLGPEIEEDSP